MSPYRRGTLLAFLALLVAALWLFFSPLIRDNSQTAWGRLGAYLPDRQGSLFFLDLAGIRKYGLLRPETQRIEAEYKDFLSATNFYFERDLDRALLLLSSDRNIYLAQGRFDLPALRRYTEASGGRCVDRVCSAPSTLAGQWISFFPVEENILAIARSKDPYAAAKIHRTPGAPASDLAACSNQVVLSSTLRPAEFRAWLPAVSDALGDWQAASLCLEENNRKPLLRAAFTWKQIDPSLPAALETVKKNLHADSLQRNGNSFRFTWTLDSAALARFLDDAGKSKEPNQP